MKKTLDFRTLGSLMILRESNDTPTDPDWDAFLAELRVQRPNFKAMRIIVFTDGGGPTSAQRKRLAEALGGSSVQVAVVTDRTAVRFIVSSIALLNKSISTFSVKETTKAYEWLKLSLSDRRLVDAAVSDMNETAA